MREIKFRAWDKEENKMWTIRGGSFEFMEAGFCFEPNKGGFIGGVHLNLMQYTGLKDKNGKKIYEGDILFWDDGEDNCKIEVKFEDGCFTDGDGCLNELKLLEEYEVIGNIYENPELFANQKSSEVKG